MEELPMNQQISTALAELPGFPMAATKPSAAHSRRCSICRHPDRIWIELKFIEWGSPLRIAEEFELYDRDCIYHHAHATNLFELRRRNILCVYEHLLERLAHTQITSREIMFAIGRLERAVRTRLPNRVAEIETTVTRDTELVFDFKTEDEDDEEYEDEEADEEREQDDRSQSVDSGRESASQLADSESPQRQYTPTHVPHSKQPEMHETRHSFRNKMLHPETTTETKFAQLRQVAAVLSGKTGPDKLKPPD
jgi:uncharacterized protein YhaN